MQNTWTFLNDIIPNHVNHGNNTISWIFSCDPWYNLASVTSCKSINNTRHAIISGKHHLWCEAWYFLFLSYVNASSRMLHRILAASARARAFARACGLPGAFIYTPDHPRTRSWPPVQTMWRFLSFWSFWLWWWWLHIGGFCRLISRTRRRCE